MSISIAVYVGTHSRARAREDNERVCASYCAYVHVQVCNGGNSRSKLPRIARHPSTL